MSGIIARFFGAVSTHVVVRRAIRHLPHWSAGQHWLSGFSAYRTQDDTWSSVPVAAFPTAEQAEVRRAECDRAARIEFPVVRFLAASFPMMGPKGVYQTFASIGCQLPPGLIEGYAHHETNNRLLASWWVTVADQVTPEQRIALWEQLYPEFRFYDVVKVRIED